VASKRKLTVEIVGQDRSGSKAFRDVESEADGLQGKLRSAGSKAGTALKGALMLGGAAAGVALASAVLSGFESEKASDKLAAQLGGSEWAQGMGEIAGDLYASGFGESVTETADALRQVLQAGLLPEDATNAQIESMSEKALMFADVLDQDLTMATQAVSNMIRTGIAEDGTAAFDVLTRGVQQGADRAGDLMEVFQEYSTLFRDIGLSAEEATGLLSQGLKAGARDADTVADALKEFAIRGQDASETSAAGFEAIGLSAAEMTRKVAEGGPAARDALGEVLDGLQNMEDPVARNAAAVALFGTKAEDLGDALFALDLDTAAEQLGVVGGATEGLGSAYDNAASKIETFKRQGLQILTEFIGNEVIPRLGELWSWLSEKLSPAVAALWLWVQDSLVPTLQTWATEVREDVIPVLVELWAWVQESLVPALHEAWRAVEEHIIPVYEGMATEFRENVVPAIDDLVNTIDTVTGSSEEASGSGKNLADTFRIAGQILAAAAWGPAKVRDILYSIADAAMAAWRQIDRLIDKVESFPGGGSLGALTGFGGAFGAFDRVFGASGGIATPGGFEYMAAGGMPRARGIDTIPAMLSSREMVLTHDDQRNLLNMIRQGAGGGTQAVHNHYHIAGSVWSERDLVGVINRQGKQGTKIARTAVAG